MAIDPGTRPGAVRLVVRDLDRVRGFYEDAIGLRPVGPGEDQGEVALGANGDPVVELIEDADAKPRPPGTTGLFHLAILLPGRVELAAALRRAVEANAPIGGASDHLVSEALYLNDPEGNGIELYRDRARSEWKHAGGELQMSTLPLDVQGLIRELDGGEVPREAPPGTRIGHVHLNVADLESTRSFYEGALGFEVTVESYPGALFFAAGGYHHHIGANTWAGEGAPPPPPGSTGLRSFELVIPGKSGTEEVSDPSGNGILLRPDEPA